MEGLTVTSWQSGLRKVGRKTQGFGHGELEERGRMTFTFNQEDLLKLGILEALEYAPSVGGRLLLAN